MKNNLCDGITPSNLAPFVFQTHRTISTGFFYPESTHHESKDEIADIRLRQKEIRINPVADRSPGNTLKLTYVPGVCKIFFTKKTASVTNKHKPVGLDGGVEMCGENKLRPVLINNRL